MTYDGLIFDLDGTLWDAAAASTRGWNASLAELGLSSRVSIAGIRSVSGTPFERCVEILLPELRPLPAATLRALEAHERMALESSGGTLFPDVAAGVRELAGVYPLFLVSNCSDWYLEVFLRTSGLRDCLTGWDCHGSSGSPKSGMLLALVETHRLKHAVYVGDTRGDKESAEAAGMEFAFARYGFGETDAPSLAFDSFGELVDFFVQAGRPRER
ncbi:MAG: hypothetical protein A2133_12210 [Actinobacteria bacterium RBG_16_64_13]|nr:MAG: hypothetical protein A2133_12210 [Actinobacteria bacterium RBG_16_64_13]